MTQRPLISRPIGDVRHLFFVAKRTLYSPRLEADDKLARCTSGAFEHPEKTAKSAIVRGVFILCLLLFRRAGKYKRFGLLARKILRKHGLYTKFIGSGSGLIWLTMVGGGCLAVQII